MCYEWKRDREGKEAEAQDRKEKGLTHDREQTPEKERERAAPAPERVPAEPVGV